MIIDFYYQAKKPIGFFVLSLIPRQKTLSFFFFVCGEIRDFINLAN